MYLVKHYISKARSNPFFQDSFWALFGNVFGKGLSLAAGIVVARFLGNETFGEYSLIRNTIITISIFSTFGLGYSSTKFVAQLHNKTLGLTRIVIDHSIRLTLIVSSVMALLLTLTSDYVASSAFGNPDLSFPLRIVALLIVVNALITTQVGILSGLGSFKTMSKINTVTGVVTFVLSSFLAFYFGLAGALLALLFAKAITCYWNYLIIKKNFNEKLVIEKEEIRKLKKEINKFSIPIGLQEAFYSISFWFRSILIVKMTTFGELGIYSAAMQWNVIILFIPGILQNVILSHFSKTNNNEVQHRKILNITLMVNLFATLVPAIVISIFSDYIKLFYGDGYGNLEVVIVIAVFTTVFSSLANVYSKAFMSKGKNWLIFLIGFGRDSVLILLMYGIFLSYEKLDGALVAVGSQLLILAIYFLILYVLYKLQEKKDKLKPHIINS